MLYRALLLALAIIVLSIFLLPTKSTTLVQAGNTPLQKPFSSQVSLPSQTDIPTDYVGKWTGDGVQQNPSSQWTISITLTSNATGQIAYPSLSCGGTLTLLRVLDNSIEFEEHITYGGGCVLSGKVTLEKTSNQNTLIYKYVSGFYTAQGLVRKENTWIDLKPLQQDYQSKIGTNGAAYAHQILCIATRSCQNFEQFGADGWANGFIKFLFDNMVGTDGLLASQKVTCRDWLSNEACFNIASYGVHSSELLAGFVKYCIRNKANTINYNKWDTDHEQFLNIAVKGCFDEVAAAGELSASKIADLKTTVPEKARNLRQTAQAICSRYAATLGVQSLVQVPLCHNK